MANNVGELLAYTPQLLSAVPKQKVAQSFSTYVNQVTDGNIAELARRVGRPKNTVWLWCSGQVLPQLNLLVKVCHSLGLSLLELFMGEPSKENSNSWVTLCSSQTLKPKLSTQAFDSQQVRQCLQTILQEAESPPPSMQEVARRLNYHVRFLRRHFPQLCCAVSARYLAYRKMSRIVNLESSCREVRAVALELHAQGIEPTRSCISKYLSKPAYFRDREVSATLDRVRYELGCSTSKIHPGDELGE